jgi:hypothetical protein
MARQRVTQSHNRQRKRIDRNKVRVYYGADGIEEMSPEQALQVLDAATALLNASRTQHAQIVQALQVLSELVKTQETTNGRN